MVFKYFVNPERLRDYKYSSSDLSISYVYILSPLANYLVQYIPLSISANLVSKTQITLIGHLMVVFMYLTTFYYCGLDLECRLPDNSILLSFFLYMAWLILDNIDGKQARRTRSSSPLGLMFDHQVDALNVTITTCYIANIFMAPSQALLVWFVGALPFYYTTWEETYTGALNFPVFSAASDGCLIIGILIFVFYALTPEAFIHNAAFGYVYRDIILGLLMFSSLVIVAYNVYTVYNKSKKVNEAMVNGLSFGYFILCYWHLHMFSPSSISIYACKELMLCFGFCFAREIGYLQIAHVLNSSYTPMNLPNFTILSILILNTSSHAWGYPLFDEYHTLIVLALLAFFSYAHLIISVSIEITRELNIPIFSLPIKINVGDSKKQGL